MVVDGSPDPQRNDGRGRVTFSGDGGSAPGPPDVLAGLPPRVPGLGSGSLASRRSSGGCGESVIAGTDPRELPAVSRRAPVYPSSVALPAGASPQPPLLLVSDNYFCRFVRPGTAG